MFKNALFLWKNRKNRRELGLRPPDLLLPAARDFPPDLQPPAVRCFCPIPLLASGDWGFVPRASY